MASVAVKGPVGRRPWQQCLDDMRVKPLDHEVFALALPALGALAAEPLYILVDTAIVGHLGTTQLASLAIAATVLSTGFTMLNFLTYGTTAQVARLHGAGRDRDAAALGSQALWLALFLGLFLLIATQLFAPPAVSLMGGEDEVAEGAVLYLRIAAIGGPFFMIAAAGQGFLRGMGDLRTPLIILVVAHAVNVVLEVLFVYGFGWGLAGSAWGTVIAQAGMGLAFVQVQRRAGFEPPILALMRPLIRIGSEIAVRTGALLGSFLVASAVLARVGSASLAAHQIAFQLFVFLALVLDALAIAAQVMVGRLLGAGDAARARAAATRVILWSAVVGAGFGLLLVALTDILPHAFTDDPGVVERAQEIWWLFAALMPLNGVVFALDGILIGAGDTRFLMWGMLLSAAVYIPVALLALDQGWGIMGVWWGLAGLIGMRALTCGLRFLGSRWVLTGAPA
jgi:putative MATE family efflux protein